MADLTNKLKVELKRYFTWGGGPHKKVTKWDILFTSFFLGIALLIIAIIVHLDG